MVGPIFQVTDDARCTKPPEAAQSKEYLFHISGKQRIHFFLLFFESIIIFLCLGIIRVFAKNAEITNGKMASTKLILSWRIVIYEQVGCVMCALCIPTPQSITAHKLEPRLRYVDNHELIRMDMTPMKESNWKSRHIIG